MREGWEGGQTKLCLEEDTWGEQKKDKKNNKGEEEGGNKYTKVIIFFRSLWTCGHCGERRRESERDEHKVLWVLSSKRRVEEWRSRRKRWYLVQFSLVSCWETILFEVKRGFRVVFCSLPSFAARIELAARLPTGKEKHRYKRSRWSFKVVSVHQEPLLTARLACTRGTNSNTSLLVLFSLIFPCWIIWKL